MGKHKHRKRSKDRKDNRDKKSQKYSRSNSTVRSRSPLRFPSISLPRTNDQNSLDRSPAPSNYYDNMYYEFIDFLKKKQDDILSDPVRSTIHPMDDSSEKKGLTYDQTLL